jgi:RNA polymerase sigma-70 factor (ECF subfamily)
MYRIVTNNCLMKHRAGRRRHQAVFIEDLPAEPAEHSERIAPPPVSPLEHVISGELRSAMDRAIEKLPIAHRLVFVLRDLEGLSSEETAGVLKISVEAVKSRLRRSRAFLREQLKDFVAS